jgi:dUTPase
VRIETPEVVEVHQLALSERGAGGFGSSGSV